jgi:glucosamine--fructose-6-phosphate aminotransferase (isomerizing)
VASTKGFLTQLVACYLLGLYLAQVRDAKYGEEITETMRELAAMPDAISKVLDEIQPVMELAAEFADKRSVLFIGRHVGYPVALEGALKLKELAYIHAEGFAAGELHDKVISNLQEVRARGAKTIVLAEEDDDEVSPYADVMIRLPKVSTLLQPLVATVPLQMFACELATKKGHDVDQPRNLAKSVTVE